MAYDNEVGTCTVVLTILLSLYEFFLGVAEAVYVSKYDKYETECQGIWGWIVAACVINICVPIFTGCGATKLIKDKKEENSNAIVQLLQAGQLVVGIWAVVTYYNINSTCHNFWTSNAPELWTFVMIHYVMLWISVGIFVLIFVLFCVALCCKDFLSTR